MGDVQYVGANRQNRDVLDDTKKDQTSGDQISKITGEISEGEFRFPRIDESSHEFIAIGNEHHEVHEGALFFYKDFVDVAGVANTVVYFMFETPDTAEEIHAKVFFPGASVEFNVELFEDGVTSADGTPVPLQNANRNSAEISSLVAYTNPTVTDDGELMWRGKVGVGKSAGVSNALGYEIVAKRATKYLFKITKVAVQEGWVDVNFYSYKHTPIN